MKPLVSVIMSCFNAADTLNRAIDSILNQTYENFEFIIIDDGSTDATVAIVQSYLKKDHRFVFYQNLSNIGLAGSLNKGISVANGQYIARMDADDYSYPNRLCAQVSFLEENPSIDIVGSNMELVDKYDTVIDVTTIPANHDRIVKRVFRKPLVYHPTVMIKSTVFSNFGFYDSTLRWAEDADLWYRIYDKVTFHNLQTPLVRYTTREKLTSKIVWNNLKVKYKNLKSRQLFLVHGHLLVSDLLIMSLRRIKNIQF